MTQQNKPGGQTAPETEKIPNNLPLEMVPLYDWWKANGKSLVTTVGVCVIAAAAVWGGREYWRGHTQAINQALLQAQTPEELEQAIAQNSHFKAANALRLRLAKAYFDAGRYDEAKASYEACLAKGAPDGFAEIAELGRAATLEASKKFDGAIQAYQQFTAAHATHFLAFEAKLGVARCTAMAGKTADALKLVETLKAEATGKPQQEALARQTETLIKRYEPRAERSLFDQADAVAKALAPASTNAVSLPAAVKPAATAVSKPVTVKVGAPAETSPKKAPAPKKPAKK